MSALREGDVLANRYRLIRPLAHGGMGSVWLAEHTLLRAHVAVKLMGEHVRTQPALRARFEREALAAAQLKSPHIVAVQDYGFDGDTPFMVMELLEGEDLARRLQRTGRMAPRDALSIAVPIAKGLAKAHAARVVHRDLKPANIFLARVDDDEVVKIVDFGIAKVAVGASGTPDDPTSTDSIIGSPTYMSPEQVRAAREVDGRTDLWAFAVILFRMLTATVPFTGPQGDLLVKICTEPPRRVVDIVPGLWPALDAFFERALQKDPAHRYATAHEMVNAFAIAAGERQPFEGPMRISLPPVEPTPTGAPMEQAQTLASNHSGPRPSQGLPASTLALAAAPVLALAVIATLAVLRSSPEATAASSAQRPGTVHASGQDVSVKNAQAPILPPVDVAPTAPEPSQEAVPASSSSPSSSPSALPSSSVSASARGPVPQASAKPQTKERIRFGL